LGLEINSDLIQEKEMGKQDQDAENRISRTMHIVGDISFKETTIVEGNITGNVTGETMIVTETGEIIGDLNIEKIICNGRIVGSITAQRLTVGSTAQIKGKLVYTTLEVVSGARIDCEVMSSDHLPEKKKVDELLTQNVDGLQKVKEKLVKQVEDTRESEVGDEAVASTPPINPPVLMEQIGIKEFFPEGDREKIAQSIIEAIKSSKEMVKIIGDLGSGKTSICQKVCDELSGSFKVIQLDNVVGSMKELFLRLAEALNIQIAEDLNQVDILEKLKKQISGSVVLILDNSHEIYPATLEGVIKNLSYIYSANEDTLQIVLFGDSHLENHLDPKAVDYFKSHPECAFELRPLLKDETHKYIDFKLSMIKSYVNSAQPIEFRSDSVAKVYTVSQGVIGKIDMIVEKALELAEKKKSHKIVPKFIKSI
jgi:MSHA biogenesis protein MshM